MNILQSSDRQRGVSAWTMLGSLLIVAGIAGLGAALISPPSQPPRIAPIAAGGGTNAPLIGGAKAEMPRARAEKNPAVQVTTVPSAIRWQVLTLGQSGNGVAFRKVGNDAIAFLGEMQIAKCVNGSNFQGERLVYLEGTLATSRVHVSPLSPTRQYIAVFCAIEADSASSVQLVNLQSKSFFSPGPGDLFMNLDPWISFSPDDQYAVLNQAGDEGNYSALVLNLSTRKAKKLNAPLFTHDEKTQPVWPTDRNVTYRAGQVCDDISDPECKSQGIYEFEVDVTSMNVTRKRIGDWHP